MTNRTDEIRARADMAEARVAAGEDDGTYFLQAARFLLAEVDRLEAERDGYRAKLMNLADATEVSGLSWNGFNIIGDKKSVKAVQAAVHYAGQIEQYRAAFDERIATLTAERDRMREALKAAEEEFSRIECEGVTETQSLSQADDRRTFFAARGANTARQAIGDSHE